MLEEELPIVKTVEKILVSALVTSQLLVPLPVSAAVVVHANEQELAQVKTESDQSYEQPVKVPTVPDEEKSQAPEDGEREESPEPEVLPEEPVRPELTPEPKPEPSPTPEAHPEKVEPEKTPEGTPESVPDSTPPEEAPSSPVGSETDTSPGSSKNTMASDNRQASTLTITPTKETWAFIQSIGEEAREIGLKEDLYASVMIAQAILESGSGQSRLSQSPYYNLFGIKGSYEGKNITFKTQEDDGAGTLSTIEATFRQYPDHEASLNDYARLLKEGLAEDPDFYKGAWRSETASYKEATAFLTGRYATDTQYDTKLNALIDAYELARFDQEKGDLPEAIGQWLSPIKNPVISSAFGPRGDGFHRGIDFAAPIGTSIYASLSGTVIRADFHASWGNYVAIEHANGLTTLYAHNHQNLVTVGQRVNQGDVIALVGSTGNSTGPHLHFEVSRTPSLAQNQLIDPRHVLALP